jgi:hypothetical protein
VTYFRYLRTTHVSVYHAGAFWGYMIPTVCKQYPVQDLDAAWADTAMYTTLHTMYKNLRLHQVLVLDGDREYV